LIAFLSLDGDGLHAPSLKNRIAPTKADMRLHQTIGSCRDMPARQERIGVRCAVERDLVSACETSSVMA